MTAAPQLPSAPRLVSAAELVEGSDDGDWTDILVQGQRLPGAELDEARFIDCRFEECDLAGVRFSRLVLRRVEFVGCRLTGVDLGGAHVFDVRFSGCKLDQANLRGVRGERVTFDGDTILTGTEFALAQLAETTFESCGLAGVDFRRAGLTGARFPQCDLGGVLGIDGLVGTHITSLQALQIATRLATELGIHIDDLDPADGGF